MKSMLVAFAKVTHFCMLQVHPPLPHISEHDGMAQATRHVIAKESYDGAF